MKYRLWLLTAFIFTAFQGFAQQYRFTLSGGYAWGNPEIMDANTKGYRLNGLYEFNPQEGMISHGFSFGYIHTKVDTGDKVVKCNNFPFYYAPKLIFGNDKAKMYLKGALGVHLSTYNYEGPRVISEQRDMGFYGGAGVGGMFTLTQQLFLNVEYEWAFLNNNYYGDGFINSLQLGLGIKF